MNKKTSIIAITLLIAAAVIVGIILINKGDGPIMKLLISDKMISNISEYEAVEASEDDSLYIVLNKEFKIFKERVRNDIPAGKAMYASIYFVECPKGSIFTAKWLRENTVIKEETRELMTDQKGVIAYLLEGNKLETGLYTLELYNGNNRIFEYDFSVR